MREEQERACESSLRSPPPRTPNFSYFLHLFVQFRWAAAACAGLAVFIAQFVLGLESYAYAWLYSIVAGIVFYNAAFYVYLRREEGRQGEGAADAPTFRRGRQAALAQILLDLLALFGLLHFAGGLTNPFVMFFLFHVVVAGILLEPVRAAAVACFACALIFSLGVLEKTGLIAHYRPVEILGATDPLHSWLFTLGLPGVMTVTILALTFLTVSIMNERARNRNQVIELSEALDRKNRELLRVDQMRKQLLAVASHDLKSPLGAVAGYLAGMRDGYLGPLTDEQKRVVERSLDRLSRLKGFIDDVLAWSSIEKGTLRQEMRPVDLGDILHCVVEDHRDPALARGIEILLCLPPQMPLVECSSERMVQVFENLLSNAVKYSLDGGRVRVEARQEGDDLVITILDKGMGISPEDLGHLFEDFFRAPSVRSKVHGTGLGLALARRIVKAHHGDIWATSELGLGSAFFVRLPICATETPRPPPSSCALVASPAAPSGGCESADAERPSRRQGDGVVMAARDR